MRRIFFQSLIETPVWDEAGWQGIIYFSQPDAPPTLGIIFQDDWHARMIFADWHRRLGQEDVYDELRVSIYRNGTEKIIISSDPYRTSLRALAEGNELEIDTGMPLSRQYQQPRLNPTTFARFKQAYDTYQRYQIIPVINTNVPLFHITLSKRQLNFIL